MAKQKTITLTYADIYQIGCDQHLCANADYVGPDMWAEATDKLTATQRRRIRTMVAKLYALDQRENGEDYNEAFKYAQQELSNVR